MFFNLHNIQHSGQTIGTDFSLVKLCPLAEGAAVKGYIFSYVSGEGCERLLSERKCVCVCVCL